MSDTEELPPIEVDFDDVLLRCDEWQPGDIAALKEISTILRWAYWEGGQDEAIEQLCNALLEHDEDLPPLYTAKMYTYLSTLPGYSEDDHTDIAESYLSEARALGEQLGAVPQEVEDWAEIISNLRAEREAERYLAARAKLRTPAPSLPIRPITQGLRLGTVDGTLEVEPANSSSAQPAATSPSAEHVHSPFTAEHDHSQCDHATATSSEPAGVSAQPGTASTSAEPVISPSQEVKVPAPVTTAEDKAEEKRAHNKWVIDNRKKKEEEDKKRLHELRKIPKTLRKKASIAAFNSGEGSQGTIKKSKLRLKPSITNFALLRNEQEHEAEESRMVEGGEEDEKAEEGDKETK